MSSGWKRPAGSRAPRPDADDRRRVGLTLTAKGRRRSTRSAVAATTGWRPAWRGSAARSARRWPPPPGRLRAWRRTADGGRPRCAPRELEERREAEAELAAALEGEPIAEPLAAAEPEFKPFSTLVPAIIGAAMLMQTLSATVIANALPAMAGHAARRPGPAEHHDQRLSAGAGGVPADQRLGGRPVRRQARLPDRHRPLRRLLRGLRLRHQPAGAPAGPGRRGRGRRADGPGRAGWCCCARRPSTTWCGRCRC